MNNKILIYKDIVLQESIVLIEIDDRMKVYLSDNGFINPEIGDFYCPSREIIYTKELFKKRFYYDGK